jgi:hypothetical protein
LKKWQTDCAFSSTCKIERAREFARSKSLQPFTFRRAVAGMANSTRGLPIEAASEGLADQPPARATRPTSVISYFTELVGKVSVCT